MVMSIAIQKYGARYFAVYVDGELLAVTVYRKGAEAVAARLHDSEGGTVCIMEKGGVYAGSR